MKRPPKLRQQSPNQYKNAASVSLPSINNVNQQTKSESGVPATLEIISFPKKQPNGSKPSLTAVGGRCIDLPRDAVKQVSRRNALSRPTRSTSGRPGEKPPGSNTALQRCHIPRTR